MPMFFDLAPIIVVSATTFVATSLDDLLILVGFQTSDSISTRTMGLGYLAAMTLMIGVATVLAAAAEGGLPFPVGYLGVAPIGIGIYHGVLAFRPEGAGGPNTSDGDGHETGPADATGHTGALVGSTSVTVTSTSKRKAAAGFVSVFATMAANSGDSLLVFTALIADTEYDLDWMVLGTVLLMATAWVWIAHWLTEHERFRDPLHGFARFGLPILLVGVGLYILMNSPTDVVMAPGSGR
jgi:cadmium resistance protein CadD (predicted permease)